MERSTPMRKTSRRKKREALVDSVRRERFRFRRSGTVLYRVELSFVFLMEGREEKSTEKLLSVAKNHYKIYSFKICIDLF
jgi:hypothetical protein